ncbi:DUF4416 family protein [Thermodesulfovibrio thiophilus]|uniref:DUF4416 family protein n=1 Tax=Thermodesulfovibrio thiophilus TaxID=340095 RepID=UPI000412A414|nr:DUF4416 family protein [Thermodesulfovibrio thiophilus]
MGKPGQPKRVLFFIATLFKDEEIYYLTRRIIIECFGDTILESAKKYWDYSKYYSAELGEPIFRKFMFFKNLISEADISDIKLQTNQIEEKLSTNGKRTINIDPGYIGLSKLVLATTKDYSHRIYLKDGIYGEVTLIFQDNSFRPYINTYRDYADREYITLFNLMRFIYKDMFC